MSLSWKGTLWDLGYIGALILQFLEKALSTLNVVFGKMAGAMFRMWWALLPCVLFLVKTMCWGVNHITSALAEIFGPDDVLRSTDHRFTSTALEHACSNQTGGNLLWHWLGNINYLISLDVFFLVSFALIALRLYAMTYRFIKSWIPGGS